MSKISSNLIIIDNINFTLSNHMPKKICENKTSGKWTKTEKKIFQEKISIYGADWKKIHKHLPYRKLEQIRSHAQKFLKKLGEKDKIRLHQLAKRNQCQQLQDKINQFKPQQEKIKKEEIIQPEISEENDPEIKIQAKTNSKQQLNIIQNSQLSQQNAKKSIQYINQNVYPQQYLGYHTPNQQNFIEMSKQVIKNFNIELFPPMFYSLMITPHQQNQQIKVLNFKNIRAQNELKNQQRHFKQQYQEQQHEQNNRKDEVEKQKDFQKQFQ